MSEEELEHAGRAHVGSIPHSGRYPWGSGENPNQRNPGFLERADKLKKQGLTEKQIALGLGLSSTTELRARRTAAKIEKREADRAYAYSLKEKGYSNVAIGEKMGRNESSVRALLDPSIHERQSIVGTTAAALREQVGPDSYLDIGKGTENMMGVSETNLKTAVQILKDEGYKVQYHQVEQLGTGNMTSLKVLTPPETTYKDILDNPDRIKTVSSYSQDNGRTFEKPTPPVSISSSRVAVRYGPDGGAEMDGVLEIRRGVDDISLGNSKYAQVRVAVDGTHYLKGMAMYSDSLPDGVDIRFNTNKEDKGDPLKAMKPLKQDDPTNPFGSSFRPHYYMDADGVKQRSKMNIVNEEGDWGEWSTTLSSQMLSKQSVSLAKKQLGLAYDQKKQTFDEINALTNPTVKKKLMEKFADEADSAAVHLKAAQLPRQRTSVILPIKSLKDNEIYAPQFRQGEDVVLIRFPHGGKFEIPELKVNNRNQDAKNIIGQAIDAVGINHKVAARLSGADFDGDTVLVIPNGSGAVKVSGALKGLEGFDPQAAYPGYPGMTPIKPRTKQQKMGDVSNLITDMTIKGASQDELARAVRHSMVVIDSEKHNLNYKLSYKDNRIAELKEKYQGRGETGSLKGASTLISRASSDYRVPERRLRKASEGGAIDPVTGKKVYIETGASYLDRSGKTVIKTTKSTKMAEASDAYSLSSGTAMEAAYATHANKLKALGDQARKISYETPSLKYDPQAYKTYPSEVASLKAKLNLALKNAPLERQAQLLANSMVNAKKADNPGMEAADLKKLKGRALNDARERVGAAKQRIVITDNEWTAIQKGAISNNFLSEILNNADLDRVKELATPRTTQTLTSAKLSRARTMMANGYNQAEVADLLGISVSSLQKSLSGGDS